MNKILLYICLFVIQSVSATETFTAPKIDVLLPNGLSNEPSVVGAFYFNQMNKDLFGETSALPKAKFDMKLYGKLYYQTNKKKISANEKLYYQANKEKIKSYYHANPERKKAKVKLYRQANQEKIKAQKIFCKYGITLEQHNEMLIAQNYVCAICNNKETARHQSGTIITLSVDHCHSTNKVRGILCSRCNTGIGKFNEDIGLFENVIKYLKKYDKNTFGR